MSAQALHADSTILCAFHVRFSDREAPWHTCFHSECYAAPVGPHCETCHVLRACYSLCIEFGGRNSTVSMLALLFSLLCENSAHFALLWFTARQSSPIAEYPVPSSTYVLPSVSCGVKYDTDACFCCGSGSYCFASSRSKSLRVPHAVRVLHGLPTVGTYSDANVFFVLLPCVVFPKLPTEEANGHMSNIQE